MDRTVPTVIVVVVVLGLLLLMARSWRKRSARDATLAAGYAFPAAASTAADPQDSTTVEAPVFYVATTPRERPLERLAIRGLGFRARGVLAVRSDGVVIDLDGEQPVFVPTDAIETLTRASFAIDRGVETDGLVVLGWRLAESTPSASPTPSTRSVDSYFRIVDQADRARIIDAIRSIAPGVIDPTGTTESEA